MQRAKGLNQRLIAASAILVVWCAAFVLANQKPAATPATTAEAPTEAIAAKTGSRTQHPAVSQDERYYAEVMIYKGMGHESWVGVLPGDKLVPLTQTPGFDSGDFAGLFEGACDPSRVDRRYTNAKYLSKKCGVMRPGEELLSREQVETLLGG